MAYVTVAFSKGFDLEDSEFVWEVPGPISLARLLTDWGAAQTPGLSDRFFDRETGGIAASVLITLNGSPVKSGDAAVVAVSPGDEIFIMPALTGG